MALILNFDIAKEGALQVTLILVFWTCVSYIGILDFDIGITKEGALQVTDHATHNINIQNPKSFTLSVNALCDALPAKPSDKRI